MIRLKERREQAHMSGKEWQTSSQRRGLVQNSGLFVILLVFVVILTVLTKGIFIRPSNIINVLMQSTIVGITSLGLIFVIIDRGIDLSVGGIACLSSSIGAILMVKAGVPWGIAVLAILSIAVGCGLLNGLAVSKLGMAPFIATLAMLKITTGFAQYVLGGRTVFGFPSGYSVFGQGTVLSVPVCVYILAALGLIAHVILRHTSFGREVYAMGGNPQAAWLSGINLTANRLFIYSLSGLMSGVAGLVITSRIMCGQLTVGQGLEMDSIAAAVIGGVSLLGGEGTPAGAIMGALVITMINNGLNLLNVSPFLQTAVKGIIIFMAVTMDIFRRQRAGRGGEVID